jgi:2-methylcitrate dehydratase PrpD
MAATAPAVPYTRTLAEFALEIDPKKIPVEVKHETSRIVLDIIGCMVAGQVTPSGRITTELAKDEHGPLEATLAGAGKASLMPVAYANTMLANSMDFDVWGPEGHMAPVAVPVALGVAEALDLSGAEFLAGLAAGLEVGGRIGGALRRYGAAGGLQSAAGGETRGQGHMVFTAVAAAGRLLGLTAEQFHHAMGVAGYGATVPTMRKFSSASPRPMTKYDHLGLMSQAGIQAALLAQKGFTGDLEVLEGDIGFWRFSGAKGCDWDFLTRDLGSHWTLPEVSYKWFPASHSVSNPTNTLVQRMMREHGLRPEQVEHLEVRRGRNPEEPPREIRNQMEAWTVSGYTIAAGVYDVRPRRSWQEPSTFRRADLMAFMQKVHLVPLRQGDVTTTGNYWEHFAPIRVTLRANGQTFEGAQDHMPQMTDADVVEKFYENLDGLLPKAAAERIEAACWNLETLPKIRELTESLEG